MKIQIVREDNHQPKVLDVTSDHTIAKVLELYGVINNEETTHSLFFNGVEVTNTSQTLKALGVSEYDMLLYRKLQKSRTSNLRPPSELYWLHQLGKNAMMAKKRLLDNPHLLQELIEVRPDVAEAALIDDDTSFKQSFDDWMQSSSGSSGSGSGSGSGNSNNNSSSSSSSNWGGTTAEMQNRINEIIRIQQIQDNMEMAFEHLPEAFTNVPMLFIDCEVNQHPVKAFVDSGAQTTISKSFFISYERPI
jgi:DNA damage-inducible protein 1